MKKIETEISRYWGKKRKLLLIMKLTILFTVVCFLQVSATVYSQTTKFSFELKNQRIQEVLREIEKSSDFRFFYQREQVDVERIVTLNISDKTVEEILPELFKGQEVVFDVRQDNLILIKPEKGAIESSTEFYVQQQQNSVSGKVSDTKGEQLPGVTVLVKGTTSGTVTNADGNYTLSNIPENAVLQFSFVGMRVQEIPIDGRTTITVVMEEETIGIEEVVAIGYGTQTRKEVTGSVAQVQGESLKQSRAVNVSNSLAGRMAGVVVNQRNGEPGRDDAIIRIRGISTTGNNDPLIVIDGVAEIDGLNRLDPEDIKSISVLKDASAAIYGARAASGVIIVTTKRGTQGKPKITYNGNVGRSNPTRLPRMADAATYARGYREYQLNNGINEEDLTFSLEDVQKFKDGSSPLTHPNTDWFDGLFKSNSMQSRHNLSVSGGTDRIQYFLSLGATDQDGLTRGTNYSQYNFRSNIDANITEDLKIGFDLAGRKEDRKWPGVHQQWIFWIAMRSYPTELATWPNGDYTYGLDGANALAMASESGYTRQKNDIFNGRLSFEYKLPQIKGLSADGFAAVDNESRYNKNWMVPWSYSTYDPDTNTYKSFSTTLIQTSLSEQFSRSFDLTLNVRIKYTREIGKHGVNTFLAYEQNTGEGNNFSAARNKFSNSKIDQLFAGSSNKIYWDNTGSAYETARQNYFGRVSYKFADKYLADLNFRYDGSMNFPEGSRFGFFPGISLGYRISQESFFNVPFIDDLKLRASYGKLGNDRIGSFRYLQKYGYGGNYVLDGTDATGIRESGVSVPKITWETTVVNNIGLDIMFGKVYTSIDVFKNKTKDMLISRTLAIPNLAGFVAPPENSGEMENKGIEFEFDYNDRFQDLRFHANGNISYSKNKVLFIDEKINPSAPWQSQEGYKLGRLLVYDNIGIYRTLNDLENYPSLQNAALGDLIYRDVDEDGKITALDRIPEELNAMPEITFGLNLGLSYHNFDLTVFFQGQARAAQAVGYRFDGSGNILQSQLENTWTSSNTDATNPRVGFRSNYWRFRPSTFWLKDASFLRLKTLEIGYNFPKQLLQRILGDTGELRTYISGYNLFTISEIKDQDPEITSHEGDVHPQTQLYNIGLRITF